MPNDICTHLKQLLDAEKPILKKEIDKNKFYLSQKEHHEVGWREAEKYFCENSLKTWAAEFKTEYCKGFCAARYNCDLKGK